MDIQIKTAINSIVIEGLKNNLTIREMYKQAKNWEVGKERIDDLFYDLYYLHTQANALREQYVSMVHLIGMKLENDNN